MSSTHINEGLIAGAKPSSKVIQPPGGSSSNIFGTDAPPAAAPPRGRAPPSNNIFGGYEDPTPDRPKHDRLRSNVFSSPEVTTPPVGQSEQQTDANKSNPDEEEDVEKKDEEKETSESNNNEEKEAEPQQQLQQAKAKEEQEREEQMEVEREKKDEEEEEVQQLRRKSKGDNVYNPITGKLNFGQEDSPTKGSGKGRGEFNVNDSVTCLSDGSPAASSPNTRGCSPRGSLVLGGNPSDVERPTCTRRLNSEVSNPITGETRSFAIGGTGQAVSRPSTRVVQPPGGASTRLW